MAFQCPEKLADQFAEGRKEEAETPPLPVVIEKQRR